MVAPIVLYAVITGLSWDDPCCPDWLGWLVILGGAIGAGLAVIIHLFVVHKIGGYPESEALKDWFERYK